MHNTFSVNDDYYSLPSDESPPSKIDKSPPPKVGTSSGLGTMDAHL